MHSWDTVQVTVPVQLKATGERNFYIFRVRCEKKKFRPSNCISDNLGVHNLQLRDYDQDSKFVLHNKVITSLDRFPYTFLFPMIFCHLVLQANPVLFYGRCLACRSPF